MSLFNGDVSKKIIEGNQKDVWNNIITTPYTPPTITLGIQNIPLLVSDKDDIELILFDNAIIAQDLTKQRQAIVKKCGLDEYDLEKGVLYALAKMHGYTSKDIQELIDKAKDYRKEHKNVE